VRIFAASNATTRSSPRTLIQTVAPFAVTTTRTGEQPAASRATTVARATSIAVRRPDRRARRARTRELTGCIEARAGTDPDLARQVKRRAVGREREANRAAVDGDAAYPNGTRRTLGCR